MGRVRDSQRQRVYDAQHTGQWTEDTNKTRRIADLQEFVDSVTRTAWWKRRCHVRRVTVEARARNGWAWASYSVIRTSPNSRNKRVMIHELAHIFTDTRGNDWAPHGPQYCANYVSLARQFLSKPEGDALLASFRKARVKVRGVKQPLLNIKRKCQGCDVQITIGTGWRMAHAPVTMHDFHSKACATKWFTSRLIKAGQ